MSAYPDRLKDGKDYVLRRKRDGRYLGITGWSITWYNVPSKLCPFFNLFNMGKGRTTDFHRDIYKRFRSIKAKGAGELCELVPYPGDVIPAGSILWKASNGDANCDDWIGPDQQPLKDPIAK